jgi:hypothetical protein
MGGGERGARIRVHAGKALRPDDIALVMRRGGYPEETWFSFSHSSVRGPDGEVEGCFRPCLEITQKVPGERRAGLRARLIDGRREQEDPRSVLEPATRMLARHLGVNQAASAGIDPTGESAVIPCDRNDGTTAGTAGTRRLADFGHGDGAAGLRLRDERDQVRRARPSECAAGGEPALLAGRGRHAPPAHRPARAPRADGGRAAGPARLRSRGDRTGAAPSVRRRDRRRTRAAGRALHDHPATPPIAEPDHG